MFSKLLRNRSLLLKKIIILLLAVLFILFVFLFNKGERIQLLNQEGTEYEKAVVENVLKDNVEKDGSRAGNQIVSVRILTGNKKGQVFEATSPSGYLYGANCTENMKIIVSISTSGNSSVVSVYNYDREPIIYGIVVLFIIMLWVVGGKRGFKSAISLIFTFVCIIFLFIPMLYKGYSPFLSAVIITILITIVSIYLVGGLTIKTISAILGTIIGVIISGGVAVAFGHFANISSFNVSQIEELVFISNNTNLKISGLLFAAVLISSLGAVMDVSISIASTINEIYISNPNLTKKELFSSGINVGRDIIGAMSNTLILAYTGGAINTMIFIYSYNMKYNQIVNMYSIGIDIMQALSGSISIVLTVPLVSAITSSMLTNKSLKSIDG